MAKIKVGKTVASLGEYLREQRVAAQLSLRQLAEQTGVSNPYLSQIERGLRRPSAEVLQQLAKALRISAEQLYVQAGILNPDDGQVRSVELAILGDPVLSERQKQSLLDVYQSFRAVAENVHNPSKHPSPHLSSRNRDSYHHHRRRLTWLRPSSTSSSIKAEAVKPLYAVAGATEIAYEFARGYTAEAQKQAQSSASADVQTRVSKIERDPKALQGQAVSLVNARSTSSRRTPRTRRPSSRPASPSCRRRPRRFPAKVQAQIDEAVAELTKAYADLADRGEKLVAAIRKDGVKAATAGGKAVEVLRDAPKKSSVARRQAAKKGAATQGSRVQRRRREGSGQQVQAGRQEGREAGRRQGWRHHGQEDGRQEGARQEGHRHGVGHLGLGLSQTLVTDG